MITLWFFIIHCILLPFQAGCDIIKYRPSIRQSAGANIKAYKNKRADQNDHRRA